MFLNRIKAALLAGAMVAATVVPSLAIVTDPTKIQTARTCSATQGVCYMRVTVNFNDPRISSGVWFDTIPKNAYVLSVDADVTTAFNAGTTNTIQIGATASGADFLAATSVTSAGIQHLTSAAGLGVAATANTALQTAINGDVPMYVKYAQTGTAATAGVVTLVITFAKNDDE